jgi:hypothetical protein
MAFLSADERIYDAGCVSKLLNLGLHVLMEKHFLLDNHGALLSWFGEAAWEHGFAPRLKVLSWCRRATGHEGFHPRSDLFSTFCSTSHACIAAFDPRSNTVRNEAGIAAATAAVDHGGNHKEDDS